MALLPLRGTPTRQAADACWHVARSARCFYGVSPRLRCVALPVAPILYYGTLARRETSAYIYTRYVAAGSFRGVSALRRRVRCASPSTVCARFFQSVFFFREVTFGRVGSHSWWHVMSFCRDGLMTVSAIRNALFTWYRKAVI